MNRQPKRLLLAGDTHGNSSWVSELCRLAETNECDAILQLGDFGYWPHTEWGQQFLAQASIDSKKAGLSGLYFIDGNHENHDALADIRSEHPEGMPAVADNVYWIPRGHRWTWHDTNSVSYTHLTLPTICSV